jgi:hypothetical protein
MEGGALERRMEGGGGLRAALHERSVSMRDLPGRKIERESWAWERGAECILVF